MSNKKQSRPTGNNYNNNLLQTNSTMKREQYHHLSQNEHSIFRENDNQPNNRANNQTGAFGRITGFFAYIGQIFCSKII